MKITFKKEKKETGLSGVGNPRPNTQIKMDGLVVGLIAAPNWRTKTDLWSVRLAKVQEPTDSDPAPFRWVSLAKKFESESNAREYIKDGVLKRLGFELYQFEDF